jgi:type III secretion system YscI/HrpB-like protein
MVDVSGIQQSIQKVAEQALQDQAKKGGLDQGTASTEDVQKLQAALSQPPAEAQQVDAGQQVQGVEDVNKVSAPTEATDTPGARILGHLNDLSTNRQNMMQNVERMLSSPEKMSTGDMLKFQFEMQQVNLQTEMTTKLASEAAQKIDQLATKGGG